MGARARAQIWSTNLSEGFLSICTRTRAQSNQRFGFSRQRRSAAFFKSVCGAIAIATGTRETENATDRLQQLVARVIVLEDVERPRARKLSRQGHSSRSGRLDVVGARVRVRVKERAGTRVRGGVGGGGGRRRGRRRGRPRARGQHAGQAPRTRKQYRQS